MDDAELARVARIWVDIRARRDAHFPIELFDEHAWEALLVLFIGHVHKVRMSEADLTGQLNRHAETVGRWLKHLASKGLVAREEGSGTITLSDAALTSMRNLLSDAHQLGLGRSG